MPCVRCGRDVQIEVHHIKQRVDGGDNSPENLEERCRPCHKYEHARREILLAIERENRDVVYQKERLELLNKRLETLDKYNTIELIISRGTFQSYNIIPDLTCSLPRRITKIKYNKKIQGNFLEGK